MKPILFIALFLAPSVAFTQTRGIAPLNQHLSIEKVASDFRVLLQRPAVAFRPSFQTFRTDSVIIEKGFIYTEATEKVPIVMYKPVTRGVTSFPVVICLHGTGGSKDDESIRNLLYQFTRIGIMGVAIDARYHGERITSGANKSEQYVEAITKAWKNADRKQQAHPFYYDTVYDLWRLTDYLITRQD
ncbi:MAG: alpha/beta hydrolase, partial [Bacteroidota bacterium]|nr:alpha/beta hydrolase [Bacteroidota bacterium]